MAIRFWLGVLPGDSVERVVRLGVAQLNFGARPAIAGMGEADGVVLYSPREFSPDGPALRAFTAIGRVSDDAVYQDHIPRQAGSAWRPWRRRVDWDASAVPAPIRPLLHTLDFTRDDPDWGYSLRRGYLELSRHDFEVIRVSMRSLPPEPSRRVISGWDAAASALRSTDEHD
ncbi:EVE domain-containing protein [Planctomonas psychrotolerans]|uniref:EVE domain-containing protein n=1 Tax=Planctomonas psychrotolerans TaxID=2528712 RepID=UPI00123B0BC4|nr:EVE domain-containing protein [Planctomonas psychrotolerans]